MIDTLTYAQAPDMPTPVRREANVIAAHGRVAVVGIAVPFNDTANAHGEVIRPTTFADRPVTVAPPLLDGHDGPRLGTGSIAYSTDAGLLCVWELEQTVAAYDRLIQAIADDEAGLSISFNPADSTKVIAGDRLVTEQQSGKLNHVALTGRHSYRNAKVTALVSAFATLLHRHGRGLVALGDTEGVLTQRQHIAATEYAHTGNTALIGSMTPYMQSSMAVTDIDRSATVSGVAS